MPSRRDVLRLAAVGGAQAAFSFAGTSAAESASAPMQIRSFKWEEASIADLRAAMDSGKQTASSIAQDYLDWIAAVDKSGPGINAIIELNADALRIAKDLDAERKSKGSRGPLHGIP